MNEYEERRQRETLARVTTDAQRATVERLHAEGKTAWPEKRTGKGVVAAAKRYLTTGDAEKIDKGLYEYSIYVLNEIAHFNLGGFRSVYREVTDWIRFVTEDARHLANTERHSVHVYTDGMTGGEVTDAILRLAVEHAERLVTERQERERAAALAEAQRLAGLVGMKVVPA